MSIEVRCPSCGRLIADKEYIWISEINKLNKMENITSEEKHKRITEILESLKIPRTSYCCKMRIYKSVNLSEIVK